MTKSEIITAFQLGDLQDVEFFELATDAGMTLDEINEILAMDAAEGDDF